MSQKILYGMGLCIFFVIFRLSTADGNNRALPDSFITVHLKNASVSEAIKNIMGQTGLKYTITPANMLTEMKMHTVDLNLDHALFWTAMQQLAVKAGISIWNPYNSSVHGLQITNQNNLIGPKTPLSIKGDFLTELYGIGLSRSVNFTDQRPAIQQQFTLTMIFAIISARTTNEFLFDEIFSGISTE